MTSLGKILLVINLLAAAGVVYLATQSWSKRQELNSTALRYGLTIYGLPTDGPAVPADPDSSVELKVPNGLGGTTDSVRVSIIKTHFAAADGGKDFGDPVPVLAVANEVIRAKGKLDAFLNSKSVNEQLTWLCGRYANNGTYIPGTLVLLADTVDERDTYKGLLRTRETDPNRQPAEYQKNLDIAKAALNRKFDAATNKPNPKIAETEANDIAAASQSLSAAGAASLQADTALTLAFTALANDPSNPQLIANYTQAYNANEAAQAGIQSAEDAFRKVLTETGGSASFDDTDRRRRSAVLLMHLDPAAAWQKRVALVVGMDDYLHAVRDRLDRLPELPRRYERQAELEVVQFVENYEQLKALAKDRDRLLDRQREIRTSLDAHVTKAEQLYQQRVAQRDEIQSTTEGVQAEVNTLVAAQAEIEDRVFNIQRQVGAILSANFTLEDQLIQAERSRMGGR